MRSFKMSLYGTIPAFIAILAVSACGTEDDGTLTADAALHLEDQLAAARIEGSEVPEDFQRPVEWSFDEPQPGWRVLEPWAPDMRRPELLQTEDALRLTLAEIDVANEENNRTLGVIYVDLPDWTRDDWAWIRVRARSEADVEGMRLMLGFNVIDSGEGDEGARPVEYTGETAPVIHDGSVQTYNLRADWSGGSWKGPWSQLVLGVRASGPASVDILSVAVVPKEATYAGESAGVHSEVRDRVYRRLLFTHTPGRVTYRVRVPDAGRLDLGLGVLREDAPVTFRVTAASDGGDPQTLFEETYADKEHWGQRRIDLSALAGHTVDLSLEAESPRPGTVAMWGAPTLTGATPHDKPNVVFYVIDGGAADFMSLYGYNRRTTPNLERLAARGVVFERAYSNSTWTKPSTASFMTSLQNSVMGGQTGLTDPVPEQIATMAEHMHGAGYQTGVFIANPNAGTLSHLQRGVDVMKESWEEFSYYGRENHKQGSKVLHDRFWEWRDAYPGHPFWVHFQTTDTHRPQGESAGVPFAGLFVSPEQRKTWLAWTDSLRATEDGRWLRGESWEETGIDRVDYFRVWQGLYDESMAFTDYQIGRLVERLEASGEWENTLLIVAADHSIRAAGSDQGIAMRDSLPPPWNRPILRSTVTRVPLMFVWPGHIEGGHRFSDPVSMLDVMPTLLDLLGLPRPEVAMGQSLAPLLLGTDDWEARPVILDEFSVDEAEGGVLRGHIEVIDGRWGASLEVNPWPPEEDETEEDAEWRRPVPLLLYDLWEDPFALHSLHEERPDLVEKYTTLLESQWEAHQALAQRFTPGGEVQFTPQQLKTLQSLGYIQ